MLLSLGAIMVIGGISWKSRSSAAFDYATAPVSRGDIVRVTTASGMVNPVETVQIGSYVSGRIQDLFCDYNTEVVKNQPCAKIDPEQLPGRGRPIRAAVGTAKAQLSKDQAHSPMRRSPTSEISHC